MLLRFLRRLLGATAEARSADNVVDERCARDLRKLEARKAEAAQAERAA